MVIYALISTLAVGGNYFFNIIHARQFVTLSFKNLNLGRHINSILIFAFSLFMSSLYSKIDITMLGIMSTDESVGLYSYAHKTISLAISVGTAISTVFLPRLSLYFKNNILLFHRLLQEGIRILAFILFPLAVGLFVFSTEVVFILFGERFISCAHIIQIFIPLIFVSGFGNLLCYQMVLCSGSEKILLIAYSMGAISNILFNMILIPLMGGSGAAIASVTSELILNTYELIKMKKKIGFRIDTKILGQGIVSSLIMGVILALFKRNVDINIILKLMLGVLIGICVYIISNFVLKNQLLFDIKEKISEKL